MNLSHRSFRRARNFGVQIPTFFFYLKKKKKIFLKKLENSKSASWYCIVSFLFINNLGRESGLAILLSCNLTIVQMVISRPRHCFTLIITPSPSCPTYIVSGHVPSPSLKSQLNETLSWYINSQFNCTVEFYQHKLAPTLHPLVSNPLPPCVQLTFL